MPAADPLRAPCRSPPHGPPATTQVEATSRSCRRWRGNKINMDIPRYPRYPMNIPRNIGWTSWTSKKKMEKHPSTRKKNKNRKSRNPPMLGPCLVTAIQHLPLGHNPFMPQRRWEQCIQIQPCMVLIHSFLRYVAHVQTLFQFKLPQKLIKLRSKMDQNEIKPCPPPSDLHFQPGPDFCRDTEIRDRGTGVSWCIHMYPLHIDHIAMFDGVL